jgi:tetratricopeptide (TPR) repeat protein
MNLCLVMIVLDEEQWLPETLRAARELGIDYWVICDTGSTDETRAVVEKALESIPGEWHDIPFDSIGQARTELLRLAHGKADWLLMLDADMTVKGELPSDEDAEVYHGTIEGSWEYTLPLLVSGRRRWVYRGVAHSYLAAEDGNSYTEAVCDLRIEDRRPGGWRPGKLEEDARLLERELEKNPLDARSSFYLAQTYADLGRTSDALREYGRRILLGGYDQERFVAKLRRARLLCEREPQNAIGACLDAWQERPTRAEPLYVAARQCRLNGWNEAALMFARQAAAISRPNDRLFVEHATYAWGIPMELAIAEMRAGDEWTGRCMLQDLRDEDIPKGVKEWIDELIGAREEVAA